MEIEKKQPVNTKQPEQRIKTTSEFVPIETEDELLFWDKKIKRDTNNAAYVPRTLHDSILSTLAKSGEMSEKEIYYNFTDNKLETSVKPIKIHDWGDWSLENDLDLFWGAYVKDWEDPTRSFVQPIYTSKTEPKQELWILNIKSKTLQ